MKKQLIAVLILALFFTGCSFVTSYAFAKTSTAQIRMEMDQTVGYGGDIVQLSMYLTAEKLGGLQTTLSWNDGYLDYEDKSAAFQPGFVHNAQMNMINDGQGNAIRMVYGNTDGYTAQDELIFTARFILREDANGTTQFTLENTKITDCSIDLKEISVQIKETEISTAEYQAGEAFIHLTADTYQPHIGEVITVFVDVSSNGDPVGSLQGCVGYDESVLEYVSDSAAFSPASQEAAFSKIINADIGGELKFIYGSLSGCPEGTLLSAQFRVIGGQNNSHCIFLKDVKASNASADYLKAMSCYTSDVYIYPQLMPEALYYTLKQDAERIVSGDCVTLVLSAEGTEIGGFQAVLNYNEDQLEYVENSAEFTDGFVAGSAIHMVNVTEKGKIRLVYSNLNGYCADGEAIFTAQFIVTSCDPLDPLELTEIKTTNADANGLYSVDSYFVQGFDWENVFAGHAERIDAAIAPTCTTAGLTEGKHCSTCGKILEVQKTLAALGHISMTDAAVAPTCTVDGLTEGKHCGVCGEVLEEQKNVAALGHDVVVDGAIFPSCTMTGLTEGKHCGRCGEILSAQQVVPATGHKAAFEYSVYETMVGEDVIEIHAQVLCGHDVVLNFQYSEEIELAEQKGYSVYVIGKKCGVAEVVAEISDGIGKAVSCKVIVHAENQIVLPSALACIKESAFKGMPAEEIVIKENVESIEEKAFSNCKNLRLVTLPDNIIIAQDAFEGCDLLKIICSAGSSAQTYAMNHQIPYVNR